MTEHDRASRRATSTRARAAQRAAVDARLAQATKGLTLGRTFYAVEHRTEVEELQRLGRIRPDSAREVLALASTASAPELRDAVDEIRTRYWPESFHSTLMEAYEAKAKTPAVQRAREKAREANVERAKKVRAFGGLRPDGSPVWALSRDEARMWQDWNRHERNLWEKHHHTIGTDAFPIGILGGLVDAALGTPGSSGRPGDAERKARELFKRNYGREPRK